jgi:hypothetical protein
MTRGVIAYLTCAAALTGATASAGFPRPGIAGFITFVAILWCGAPRSGLLVQLTLTVGLITATAPGISS